MLHINPARSCFGSNDGWGAFVTTTATKQTLYAVRVDAPDVHLIYHERGRGS